MSKTDHGYVRTTVEKRVATIEFFHPAHNALPGNLLSDLVQEINEAGTNPDVLIILLKSAGERSFCAGASFDELMAIDNVDKGKEFFMGFANLINACRTCPKFIVGRVQGKAVGGGIGLAAATDYCMSTKYASIRLSELAIGIGPFVVGPAIERKLGVSAMSTLAMNPAEWQTAKWAEQKGLFAEVFDSTAQLDDHIDHFLNDMLSYNPAALFALKKVFWEGTDHWNDLLERRAEISGQLVVSEFTRHAIEAFKNKD